MIDVRVHGAREVKARLAALSRSLRNKIVRPAITAGCRPVVRAARAAAPSASDDLRRAIDAKVRTYKTGIAGIIGPRSDVRSTRTNLFGQTVPSRPGMYGHLVHGGTRPHPIRLGPALGAGFLSRSVGRGTLWMHPGTPVRPFLRSAFDGTASNAEAIIDRKIAEGLDKHA